MLFVAGALRVQPSAHIFSVGRETKSRLQPFLAYDEVALEHCQIFS